MNTRKASSMAQNPRNDFQKKKKNKLNDRVILSPFFYKLAWRILLYFKTFANYYL